jgi:phage-related protein
MNISVPDAAAKMASALAGEAEPMKKFGINISNAAIEAYALEKGIGVAGEKMTESDKAVARYGLLMEKTSVYAGDFTNTSDSLANKQKILGAEFDNLKISIGEKLIPVFEVMMDLVKGFSDWASQNKDIVTIIGIAIGGIAAAIVLVNAALAVSPIGWIIIGVGLLAAALVIAYKKFEPFRDIVDTVFGAMKFWITKVTIPALETLLGVFKTVFNGIATIWNNTIGKLSFKLPGWLPGDLGGAGFSMPKIPMLADGGIVSSATLAVIGEKGPEAVIPLDKMGQMGGNTVNINVNGADPQAVVDALRRYQRQNGFVPITVGV